ncbi:MAG TPA: lipid-A-disaccharide synthase [Rhizomicrobium sp.]|nr:lipid-A-disaccharide synthase [Rhizomicrobium sp.]
MTGDRPLTLMLVCGEPSGDLLGAQLMMRLKSLAGSGLAFSGVGGPAMTGEGLQSLFPIDVTAVMGFGEVIPRIPEILRRIRYAADFALNTRPDALVCIDSPDFTHRIAQRVRRSDPSIATVNYVAPQVWASRGYRAKKMARYFDLVLALLPFEAQFFQTHGLHARFVGHPVVERRARIRGGAELRQRLGIAPEAPLLALLPGSRFSEIRPLLPIFRDTVERVRQDVPDLVCLLPTMPHIAAAVRQLSAAWPVPLHIMEDEPDKFAALGTADAALAASGTVTTELALAGVPMVVAYKVGAISHAVAKAIVRVPHVSIVNLLLGREAVPEFLQTRCRPELLSSAVVPLFRDQAYREQQKHDLREAVHLLGVDDEPPSLRAARVLLDFVQQRRSAAQRSSSGT